MSETVHYTVEGDIAVLALDHPPVNALSAALRRSLEEGVAKANNDAAVKAILIHGSGRAFIAGADIREFGKPPQPPVLTEVITGIEDSVKPVITAIHGFALGGGLEVALGSHFRVALPGTKLGLPEVNIGVLPGAGGTQRLPRLIGMEKALDMITSGQPIDAKEGLALGLIDELSPGDDVKAAGLALARKVIDEKRPIRRTRDRKDKLEGLDHSLFASVKKKLEKSHKGQVSPSVAVDIAEKGLSMAFLEALKAEREAFMDMLKTPQRDALVHAFFAERDVAAIPEAKAAKPRALSTLGVIGGGTMGSGIAMAAINAGLPVIMVENDEAGAARGRANVTKILDGMVEKGRLAAEKRDAILSKQFQVTTDFASLKDVDLVIEAVFEDIEVKKQVFAKLDKVVKQGAIIATNTSYLDINAIAASISRPADVIGLHFFSPAHIMKLLEIVVADKTAADVVATAFDLGKKLKKIAVRAGVCDGFIGNRILATYREAADAMVQLGASPYAVDKALVTFGFAMGPYAVSDLAGLDIGFATRKRKAPFRLNRPYPSFPDKICEKGWYGQKTGRGFYLYPNGARVGTPDPEIEAIIAEARTESGITPKSFSDEEIVRRYMAAMINEAAKVVEEGIALRPLDVDVVFLNGYGFPRFRGGPLKYADQSGLAGILADIRSFEPEDPVLWKPAQLLIDLVAKGETFASLNTK